MHDIISYLDKEVEAVERLRMANEDLMGQVIRYHLSAMRAINVREREIIALYIELAECDHPIQTKRRKLNEVIDLTQD